MPWLCMCEQRGSAGYELFSKLANSHTTEAHEINPSDISHSASNESYVEWVPFTARLALQAIELTANHAHGIHVILSLVTCA